jgi:hypothetical protein
MDGCLIAHLLEHISAILGFFAAAGETMVIGRRNNHARG